MPIRHKVRIPVSGGTPNARAIRTVTTTATVGAADDVMLCDTTAAFALTLELCIDAGPGRQVWVKDSTGNATAQNVTITPAGADTIDGGASAVLSTDDAAVMLVSDGVSRWSLL